MINLAQSYFVSARYSRGYSTRSFHIARYRVFNFPLNGNGPRRSPVEIKLFARIKIDLVSGERLKDDISVHRSRSRARAREHRARFRESA